MTIVLADADARFRDSLKRRLEKITGVEVVGEASDSEEATAMILNRKPDIAILNSSLQASSGIGVLRTHQETDGSAYDLHCHRRPRARG